MTWEVVRLAGSFDAPLRLHCDPLGSGPQHLRAFSSSTKQHFSEQRWEGLD